MNKHKQAIAAAILEKLRPGDIVHIPRPRGAGRVKDSCTQQWPDRLPFGCWAMITADRCTVNACGRSRSYRRRTVHDERTETGYAG